jgi:hypothetical protein
MIPDVGSGILMSRNAGSAFRLDLAEQGLIMGIMDPDR